MHTINNKSISIYINVFDDTRERDKNYQTMVYKNVRDHDIHMCQHTCMILLGAWETLTSTICEQVQESLDETTHAKT